MTVDLPTAVENDLKDLAAIQGREIEALVEEAIRCYLEGTAITDLTPEEIAKSQLALLPELPDLHLSA